LQLASDGTALVDSDLRPVFKKDQSGKHVEVPEVDAQTQQPIPSADVLIDDYEYVCHGPRERVIAYRDFLQLPGHAKEKSEVWGYAKRFWRRLDELTERVEQHVYDKTAVDELGTDDERASDQTLAGE